MDGLIGRRHSKNKKKSGKGTEPKDQDLQVLVCVIGK